MKNKVSLHMSFATRRDGPKVKGALISINKLPRSMHAYLRNCEGR